MDIRPIRTDADYQAALKAVSPYFDQEPAAGTEDADRFEVMLTLIQGYEAKHHPIDPPDPIEAIKFRMEQQDLSVKDLEPFIGQSNRVYEVLSRRRPLTLRMIRRIHAGLGIPAEVLINPSRDDEGFVLVA
jgi:HTH-type transcriptional regulator/antitoxin HigA